MIPWFSIFMSSSNLTQKNQYNQCLRWIEVNIVSHIKCWWASEVKTNVKYGVKEETGVLTRFFEFQGCWITGLCWNELRFLQNDRFFFNGQFTEWLCFILNCLFKYRFTRHFLVPNDRSLYQHSVKRTTICLFFESKITLS